MEQPSGLFKGSICNFYVSKICKNRVHGNEKMNLPCAFIKCPGSLHFTLLRHVRIALEASEKFLAKYSKIAPTPHQSLLV